MPSWSCRRRSCLGSLAALAPWARATPAEPPLRYIAPGAGDRFSSYVLTLLQRVSADSGLAFQAIAPVSLTQRRLELEVGRPGGWVDLMWGMSSIERRDTLRRIEPALDDGLIGCRLLVVRRGDLGRWPATLPVPALQARRAGQGLHWPDVAILRDNGFTVQTSAGTPALYEMLQRGHIDYFPRSALEVRDELDALGGGDFAIVPGLALKYPAGNHIFAGRHQAPRIDLLEGALARLVSSGELKRVFGAAFDPVLRPLALGGRRVISLSNRLDA